MLRRCSYRVKNTTSKMLLSKHMMIGGSSSSSRVGLHSLRIASSSSSSSSIATIRSKNVVVTAALPSSNRGNNQNVGMRWFATTTKTSSGKTDDTTDQQGDKHSSSSTSSTSSSSSTPTSSSSSSEKKRIFVAGERTLVERETYVESMTPKKIVTELDRYIIGQSKAKRAVAVSLRNRWRRQQLDDVLRKEVLPMNILMMGPTGTGKTEIARRLAQQVDAPFVKVEATKYTEIGIVGANAEDCIKDLVEKSVKLEREKKIAIIKEDIDKAVEKHILGRIPGSASDIDKHRQKLRDGEYDNTKIEVASFRLEAPPQFPMLKAGGVSLNSLMSQLRKPRSNVSDHDKQRDRVPVSEAREIIREFELQKAIDEDDIRRTALKRAEESGIVFLDEIDKLCSDSTFRGDYKGAKGEGVQKELLGLMEGTTVQTDYGVVRTDHILFIAAGAFHHSKPSDLLPELQGRLPIRVELEPLTEADFKRILTETESNLIKQQKELFATEGVELVFTEDAIATIAKYSRQLNENLENIGARRLRAVIAKIVEDISYEAPDKKSEKLVIDSAYVTKQLDTIIADQDLSKYIL